MKRLLLVVAIASLATPAIARDYDAKFACLIGQAAVSLNKQMGNKIDAKTATSVAIRYADKRCKERLSSGADDYVWHSVHGMAKVWFDED